MRLSDLQTRGILPAVMERWKKDRGETLLPIQRTAIRNGLLDPVSQQNRQTTEPINMLISAPTSSGKSFCAEMAAVAALAERRKVLVLSPLRSLAEQVYAQWRRYYQPLGIDLLICTSDHPENDPKFLTGDFQIAVSIYEKCDLLLSVNLDLLSSVGLVVVDELQMIAEEHRGSVLERLLTKILASKYSPRVIALSAVLDEQSSERLASWLSARVIRERSRPVDLLRGVAVDGSVRLQSFNSSEESSEPFASLPAEHDLSDRLVEQLRGVTQSTIVFLKSRQDTVRFAFHLAAAVGWSAAREAIDKLQEEEQSYLVRSLSQVLTRGIAFHNADLTRRQQEIVEQAFIDKQVKVLCSTTTLALGVNLPASAVYLETMRYTSGTYDRRPQLVPISQAEFDNMTGRAGRFGMNEGSPGRAIVLADSEFDREVLWRQYLCSDEPEPLSLRPMSRVEVQDWFLHMVCAGLIYDETTAIRVMKQSLHSCWHSDCIVEPWDIVEELAGKQLVRCDDRSVIEPTATGRAAVRAGLSVGEAEFYGRMFDRQLPESPLGWIMLALSSPYWEMPPSMLTRREQAENLPVRMFFQRFDQFESELSFLVGYENRSERDRLSFRQLAGLKAALLLNDWRNMTPVQQLEERYQIHLGQITSLGDMTAHLISAVAALLEARDVVHPNVLEQLHHLVFSVSRGLSRELFELYQAVGSVLLRSDFLKLDALGVRTMAELAALDESQWKTVFGDSHKMLKAKELSKSFQEENNMRVVTTQATMLPSAEPDSIEIIGAPDRERFLVRINGFPVPLTGKSFKYLTKLAWSRVSGDTGWLFKEELEVGFNQARYLYRMKNEIAAGYKSAWPIVENNRLGYYRLQIDPQKIRLDTETLRSHPDWEVRQLFTVGSSGSAVN